MGTHSVLRPKGTIIYGGDGPDVVFDTLQCCHCGAHWEVKPGSGNKRGFCMKCMAPTCGAHACNGCVPVEKRLELIEKDERRRIILP